LRPFKLKFTPNAINSLANTGCGHVFVSPIAHAANHASTSGHTARTLAYRRKVDDELHYKRDCLGVGELALGAVIHAASRDSTQAVSTEHVCAHHTQRAHLMWYSNRIVTALKGGSFSSDTSLRSRPFCTMISRLDGSKERLKSSRSTAWQTRTQSCRDGEQATPVSKCTSVLPAAASPSCWGQTSPASLRRPSCPFQPCTTATRCVARRRTVSHTRRSGAS